MTKILATEALVYTKSTTESVNPLTIEQITKEAAATGKLILLIPADRIMTSANSARINPMKVKLLPKINRASALLLKTAKAAIPLIAKAATIHPYTAVINR